MKKKKAADVFKTVTVHEANGSKWRNVVIAAINEDVKVCVLFNEMVADFVRKLRKERRI